MTDRTPDNHPPELAGRRCVIATMHQKESVMGPLLEKHFGVKVEVPTDFNTDQFGTFSGEVERAGSQLEAGGAKARAASKHTGADLVVASEGSFSPHRDVPLLTQQLEMIVLIDEVNQHEIIGQYVSVGNLAKKAHLKEVNQVIETARDWGFPDQGVILKTSPRRLIKKDCLDVDSLIETTTDLMNRFLVHQISLETDLRAHRCPGRRDLIAAATMDLIKKYQSRCPRCQTPGFNIKETVSGLPCANCSLPTSLIKQNIYRCERCSYTEKRDVEQVAADPGDCAWCNP